MMPKDIKETAIYETEERPGEKLLIMVGVKIKHGVEVDKRIFAEAREPVDMELKIQNIQQELVDRLMHDIYGWVPDYINQHLWPMKAIPYFGSKADMLNAANKLEASLINMRMIAKGY